MGKNIDTRVNVLLVTEENNGIIEAAERFSDEKCLLKTVLWPEYSMSNIYIRLKKRFNFSTERYLLKRQKQLRDKIRLICNEFNPKIICVVKGTQLGVDSVDILKKKYVLTLVMSDKIMNYPTLLKIAPHYDIVYAYTQDDVEQLKAVGANCVFAPAIGDSLFHKVPKEKDIDVSFVGSVYPATFFGNRYNILTKLIVDFPKAKLRVYGKVAPLRRPLLFFNWIRNSRYKKIFINKNVLKQECNDIYNRSKICLCIEQTTGNGWSGRVANCLRTGSFVLANYNEITEKVLGDCLILYKNYEDLRDKIQHYLTLDKERAYVADFGYTHFLENMEKHGPVNLFQDICNRYKDRLK